MSKRPVCRLERSFAGDDEGAISVVTGKVTDAHTSANLKGALVTIEETGQWTSTGDLGRFRFASVPAGEYTLTVSFLGYAGLSAVISVRGDAVAQDFELRGGSEIEEIVVFGQRSARALALSQERSADNMSTVVSSDLLGNLEGTTIAEALRKAPGVSFSENSETGDGINIIVRGVDPDLNSITLNGIELPEASGQGRSADLSNILAESVDSISISKTLLPSQDTSGTGGLVEIETKSPFDRDVRFLSFFAEGSTSDESVWTEQQYSATVSGIFGSDEQFGLSGSIQYRQSERERFGYSLFGQAGLFLPLQIDGSPTIRSISQVDPRIEFPFEPEVDQFYLDTVATQSGNVEVENLGISLTFEWEPAEHTNLRFDYQEFSVESTIFRGNSNAIGALSYSVQPVAALAGDQRAALSDRNRLTLSQNYGWFPETENSTDVFSFRGSSKSGKWSIDYSAGYTKGETPRSRQYSLVSSQSIRDASGLFDGVVVDPVEGRVISNFGRRTGSAFPSVPFNDAGSNLLNDPSAYFLSTLQLRITEGENTRENFETSVRYDFGNNIFKYVRAGVQFERSEFSSILTDDITAFPGVSLADFGFTFTNSGFSSIGVNRTLPFIRENDVTSFLDRVFGPGVNNISLTEREINPLAFQENTLEDELALYVEGKLQFGDIDVVGGFRFSQFDIRANTLAGTSVQDVDRSILFRDDSLVEQSANIDAFLPRFLVNYRPSENLVARFGYFRSSSRPRIEQVNDSQNVLLFLDTRFSPEGDRPTLVVRSGNPELKPSTTDNFDLSLEYYFDDVGVIKAGAFYKSIDDFIQDVSSTDFIGIDDVADFVVLDNEEFQSFLPDEVFIRQTIPTNSDESAEIWGLELSIERQFSSLPGLFSGLGIFANYTYTDSERTVQTEWSGSPILDDSGNFVGTEEVQVDLNGVPFNQQPDHSGTIGFTYNKAAIDAFLSYTLQERRQTIFDTNNLSRFSDSIDSLDFRLEYRPTADRQQWVLFVEGFDLLDAASDPSFGTSIGGINGAPEFSTGATYFGGRQVAVGVRAAF